MQTVQNTTVFASSKKLSIGMEKVENAEIILGLDAYLTCLSTLYIQTVLPADYDNIFVIYLIRQILMTWEVLMRSCVSIF